MGETVQLPYEFSPRSYQVPLLKAMDEGKKRAVIVWHRRSGKEKTCVAGVVAKKMAERVGSYYYVFPELTQGRKVLWDGMDRNGMRFIDHFPAELLDGPPNNSEMKLRYKCGSLFQVVGSDRFDAVMGANPIGMVFSEYSLQDPACWGYFRPILAENDGWAVFNFTPRGENHAHDLYCLAKEDPKNWFSQILTVDDTLAVPTTVLAQERSEIVKLYGSDALYRQEYYCDFTVPITGAYYSELVAAAYQDGRVCRVPHEPRLRVETAWDLGVNDRTSIWFVQVAGSEVRVIDYLEGSGKGLPWYAQRLAELSRERGYVYGRQIAPHDIKVREFSSGVARIDTAHGLGLDFEVVPNLSIAEGIDAVRAILSRCRFDKEKCSEGINALKSYRKQYDDKRKTYLNHPYHDWSSNGADAFRYLALALDPDYRSAGVDGYGDGDKYFRAGRRYAQGKDVAGQNPVSIFG